MPVTVQEALVYRGGYEQNGEAQEKPISAEEANVYTPEQYPNGWELQE